MLPELSHIFTSFKTPSLNTDSFVSKLVYRVLLWMLVSFFLCVALIHRTSSKIYCYTSTPEKQAFASEFCLGQGTFLYADPAEEERARTILQASHPGVHGHQPPWKALYPGVRAEPQGNTKRVYHFFYLYSEIYFALMAITCYGGRLTWRKLQGGLISNIIGSIKKRNDARGQPADRNALQEDADIEEAARVLFESRAQHHCFALKYGFSKIINCLILVCQILLMMMVAGFDFWTQAPRVFFYVNQPYSDWPYGLAKSFPMVTKCHIKHYGPSGNEVLIDSLCFLHFNQLNLLLFTIHWCLAYIILFVSVFFTTLHFKKMYQKGWRVKELRSVLYLNEDDDLYDFVASLSPGTAFVVVLLSKNAAPHVVRNILLDFRMEVNVRMPS